jgi:hypothetical protein
MEELLMIILEIAGFQRRLMKCVRLARNFSFGPSIEFIPLQRFQSGKNLPAPRYLFVKGLNAQQAHSRRVRA